MVMSHGELQFLSEQGVLVRSLIGGLPATNLDLLVIGPTKVTTGFQIMCFALPTALDLCAVFLVLHSSSLVCNFLDIPPSLYYWGGFYFCSLRIILFPHLENHTTLEARFI